MGSSDKSRVSSLRAVAAPRSSLCPGSRAASRAVSTCSLAAPLLALPLPESPESGRPPVLGEGPVELPIPAEVGRGGCLSGRRLPAVGERSSRNPDLINI